jgi:hypothetical protein
MFSDFTSRTFRYTFARTMASVMPKVNLRFYTFK